MVWQPGQSGNPGGKRKTKTIAAEIARQFGMLDEKSGQTHLALCVKAMIVEAQGGSVTAFVALSDRLEGKPAQQQPESEEGNDRMLEAFQTLIAGIKGISQGGTVEGGDDEE